MLLILEVVLTVAAWRRGWRAWALLPLAALCGVGVLWGLVGGNDAALFGGGLLLDLGCITALYVLSRYAPRRMSGGAKAAPPVAPAVEPVEGPDVLGAPSAPAGNLAA